MAIGVCEISASPKHQKVKITQVGQVIKDLLFYYYQSSQ